MIVYGTVKGLAVSINVIVASLFSYFVFSISILCKVNSMSILPPQLDMLLGNLRVLPLSPQRGNVFFGERVCAL